MHTLRQLEAEVSIHDKSHATLAGLGIDAHDRLVLSADIRRIDREIRYLPGLAFPLFHSLYTLIDGILMRSGEGCKYQLAGIRMSGVNLHLTASLIYFNTLVHMLNGQLRINALGEHVIGYIHDVHIAGPLTVAEQSTLHAFGTGKQSQLRTGYPRTSVIVGMHT